MKTIYCALARSLKSLASEHSIAILIPNTRHHCIKNKERRKARRNNFGTETPSRLRELQLIKWSTQIKFFIKASVIAFECEVKSKLEDLLWVSKKEGKEVGVGLSAKNIFKCMILFLRTWAVKKRERKAQLKQYNVLRQKSYKHR